MRRNIQFLNYAIRKELIFLYIHSRSFFFVENNRKKNIFFTLFGKEQSFSLRVFYLFLFFSLYSFPFFFFVESNRKKYSLPFLERNNHSRLFLLFLFFFIPFLFVPTVSQMVPVRTF